MTRTYDRETKHYDFKVLTHLVETGQATFFDGPGIYVIKTEDGTVAVRPHQVIFTPDPAPFTIVVPEIDDDEDGERAWVDGEWRCEAERLVEAYLTALHGPAENRDGEFDDEARDLVERLLAQCGGPLWDSLKAQTKAAAADRVRRGQTAWMSADEEDEVLKYFGI